MYTDPSGYVGILVAGMGVMTSSEIQEAQNEAIMFNIGMNLLSQLWAIKEVHAITYIATEVILLIAVEDALDGDELQPAMRIAVELLEDALNDIESLCEEAKINSESIAERIKEALYQAKSKGKNPEKGKKGGKDKDKSGDKENQRSKNPPARRNRYSSRKEAYEAAKRAGGGKEPRHDLEDPKHPHYHPDVKNPQRTTPKEPCSHDHYYYPKNK